MAAPSPTQPFIWGAGGAALTPEQVARQREIAQALMAGGMDYSPVDHWLQGAARAAQSGVGALKERWANEAETEGRQGFQSQWGSIFSGGGSPVAAALAGGSEMTPAMGGASAPQTALGAANALASVPSGQGADYIRSGLINRGLPEHVADAFLLNMQDESGLNPGINEAAPLVPGSRGGYGLYQLTGPRRRAYEAYASQQGIPLDSVDGQLDFLMSELQGPEAAAAKSILSAPDTGSAAAAIVNQFLRPSEQHRARREAAYLGGASRPPSNQVAQAGGGQPSVAQLLSLAGNEWANPGQSNVISALLNQQMQQQDPRYQQQLAMGDLQMQQLQRELNAVPEGPKPIEVGGVLLDPVTYKPIFDSRSENGGFTLSPGQQRFNPDGSVVAGVEAPVEAGFVQITPDEASMTGLDPSKSWQRGPDGRIYEVGNSGVNVTTNVAGGNKFDEAFATQDAAALSTISDAGIAAQRNLGRIDQLENLLQGAPSGFGAMLSQRAGEFGIPTEGLDTIQAAQALINSLVPEQRQPGSGPMSDADLELFKQSLPRIINTPQGNKTIIDTMRAVAKYDADGAEIVSRIRLPEGDPNRLTRDVAFRMLQERVNPLENFKGSQGESGSVPAPQNQSQAPRFNSQAEFDAAPSGTVFTAPDGSIRVKP